MKNGTSPAPAAGAAALGIGLLAGLLVAVHLVVDEGCYDVSQQPRLLALLAGLIIAAPASLLSAAGRRFDASILRAPTVLAAASLLGFTALSLCRAVNASAGLTDLFRSFGMLLVLCLACLVLPTLPQWRERLLQVAVVGGLVAAAVGWYQTLAWVGIGWHGRRAMEVVTGLMSNVNLHASFLLLLVPWCGAGIRLLHGRWRIAAGLATSFLLALLVLLQSRAAWLGLTASAIGAVIAVLAARRSLGITPAGRRGILAASALAAAGAIGGATLVGTDTDFGRTLSRLIVVRPHQAAGPTDGGRTMIWGVTARMILDHPLVGVGAGNFTVRLQEYYGDGDLDFSNLSSDNWLEPHNDFLWVAAEKGLPGLGAFVVMLGAAAWSLGRTIRAGRSRTDTGLAIATLAALIGYVVVSGFDFPLDRVSHQVLLALVLAVATVLDHEGRTTARRPVPLPAWLVLPPLLAALGLGAAYAAAATRQEHAVIAARRAYRDGDWEGMRAAARQAASPWKTLDPLATPIAYLEGKAELQLGRIPEAVACLERAWEANPNRLYVLNDLGIAYAANGQLEEAIACFRIAANRYPSRIEPRQNLANGFLEAGLFVEAVAVLEDVPEPLRTAAMREALELARAQIAAQTTAPATQPVPNP